jgi:hypothetical protein
VGVPANKLRRTTTFRNTVGKNTEYSIQQSCAGLPVLQPGIKSDISQPDRRGHSLDAG